MVLIFTEVCPSTVSLTVFVNIYMIITLVVTVIALFEAVIRGLVIKPRFVAFISLVIVSIAIAIVVVAKFLLVVLFPTSRLIMAPSIIYKNGRELTFQYFNLTPRNI